MHARRLFALSLLVSACGSDSSSSSAKPLPAQLALVSDWAQGTVSIVDFAELSSAGATRASATTATIDLSAYPPGPFEAVITPDKKHALVSCSANFFSIGGASSFLLGGTALPAGTGALVLVDLEKQAIVKEIGAIANPADIVFTPDGKRAIVVGFGTGTSADSTLEVVDLETLSVVQSTPAGIFAEGLAIDDSGEVGIYSFGTQGQLATFPVSDPSKLSPEISLPGDTAGVAFFPGTKTAFAIQAVGILGALTGGSANGGYTIVDVSDPSAPKVTDDVRLDEGPVGFPVAPASNRGTVLVAVTVAGKLVLREYALEQGKAKLANSIEAGESTNLFSALSIAYDGDHTAFVTWPTERALLAIDLETKSVRTIDWSGPNGQVGPAYVALPPTP